MSLSIEVHLCKLIVVLPEDEVSVSVDEVERVPGRVGRLVEGAQRPAEPHVLLRRGGVTYSNDGRNSALGWVHYKAELIKCMSWRTRRISLPPGPSSLVSEEWERRHPAEPVRLVELGGGRVHPRLVHLRRVHRAGEELQWKLKVSAFGTVSYDFMQKLCRFISDKRDVTSDTACTL